jgi:hypothetical protein
MPERLTPSTIDDGFILRTPAMENPATADLVFQRILQCTGFLKNKYHTSAAWKLTEFPFNRASATGCAREDHSGAAHVWIQCNLSGD